MIDSLSRAWSGAPLRRSRPPITGLAASLLAVVMVLDMSAVALSLAIIGSDPPSVAAASKDVKVVIVVGPVGRLTNTFRTMASSAAAAARRYTDNVVEISTPDATWPLVRRALQGASIVVYLGHGNGWPSPYRDAPYPVTQNGFGLNPVAGVDDSAHQYFGERYLAREVRLAPNAVVLLHHLCYASGNSEPGRAEPSLKVAKQRADNYAAGFMRAGAAAVVAEGHLGPAYYVRGILSGRKTLEALWLGSPNFNDHLIEFDSVRSPNHMAYLDPDRPSGGYYRSLVLQPGLTSGRVLASASSSTPIGAGDGARSLADRGYDFGLPVIGTRPVVGESSRLTLPVVAPSSRRLPTDTMVGIRWDLIEPMFSVPAGREGSAPGGPTLTPVQSLGDAPDDVAPSMVASASVPPLPSAGPSALASPRPEPADQALSDPPAGTSVGSQPPGQPASASSGPNLADGHEAPPGPSSSPSPSAEPPAFAAIQPEQPGTLVTVDDALVDASSIAVPILIPERPGIYRLVTSIHGPDGVAYDAATQALIPALIVHVTGEVWADYRFVEPTATLAGAHLSIPLRLSNTGAAAWESRTFQTIGEEKRIQLGQPARLEVRWLDLASAGRDRDGAALPVARDVPLQVIDPGAETVIRIDVVAPSIPGDYLLVLDVVSPLLGSLAAMGVPPGMVRVHVTEQITLEPQSLRVV